MVAGMGRRKAPVTSLLLDLSRQMGEVASQQGGVVTAAQCRALGVGDSAIRAVLGGGLWVRVRRGVYADRRQIDPMMTDSSVHHRECAAVFARLIAPDGEAAFSHLSAVRLLGLPTPARVDRTTVVLTRRPAASPHAPPGGRVHVTDFDPAHVVDVGGLPVLAGPRLVLDCCATMDPPTALAVADALIARGLLTNEALERALPGWRSRPGVRVARLVAERADPLAENWLESASRWWLLDAGLPRPELQTPFRDSSGRVRARVDMFFRAQRTVAEADGRGKYEAPDALYAEKEREDWLRSEHDVEVVRWTYDDLRTAASREAVIGRVRTAFTRSSRRN
jgi:hypothetical protein